MEQKKGGLDDPAYYDNEQRQVERIMGDGHFEDPIGYDRIPAKRGEGEWEGVVLIERPASPANDSQCRVMSARTNEYNGLRAIADLFSRSFGG